MQAGRLAFRDLSPYCVDMDFSHRKSAAASHRDVAAYTLAELRLLTAACCYAAVMGARSPIPNFRGQQPVSSVNSAGIAAASLAFRSDLIEAHVLRSLRTDHGVQQIASCTLQGGPSGGRYNVRTPPRTRHCATLNSDMTP